MKFVNVFFIRTKKEECGGRGVDWKRYNNLGKIDIFNILTRPINEMGSFVHLFSRPVIESDMGL